MSAAVWFHFITSRLFSALFLFAPRLFVFYCLFVSFAFTCFMQITLQTPRQSFWDGVSVFVLLSLYELRHLNFSQRYSYIFQKLPFKEECASACSCQLWFLCTKEKDSWLLHFETKTCCLDWWFYVAATIITWNIHLMQSTDIIKNCVESRMNLKLITLIVYHGNIWFISLLNAEEIIPWLMTTGAVLHITLQKCQPHHLPIMLAPWCHRGSSVRNDYVQSYIKPV